MKKIIIMIGLTIIVFACDDIIGVEDISSDTTTIIAPTDGTTLTSTSVVFSWNNILGAEQYRVEIATPSFENASQIVLDTTMVNTSFTATLSANEYQWRIRAENSGYTTSHTTTDFVVDTSEQVDITSEMVVLLAPTNGVLFTFGDAINFSWESVSNINSYTLQIAKPNFENTNEIIKNEIITNTNFTISDLEAAEYEWRVKASNTLFETEYSTQNFRVEE